MDGAETTGQAGVPLGDSSRCPLCGASNRCAMSDPSTREEALARRLDCWCMQPQLDRARLAQLAPQVRQSAACLCPACAAALAARSLPGGGASVPR